MKHPAHHISKRLRRVRCGHQALSREITRTVKRIKDDPRFRKLAKELAGHLVEIVVRVVVFATNAYALSFPPVNQRV